MLGTLRASLRSALDHVANWHWVALLNRSRLVQACLLVPFIGYTILLSDRAFDLFSYYSLLGSPWLPVKAKLLCLYWGGIFISVNLIVYYGFCPWQVKRFADRHAYVDYELALRSRERLREIYSAAFKYDKSFRKDTDF